MAFRDVMNLRKSGNAAEAYEMAKADYQQNADDVWSKRALAWCLFDALKANASFEKNGLFFEKLAEIKDLSLSADETMFWENLPWPITTFVRNCSQILNLPTDVINSLFETIKDLPFVKPSDEYSVLLKGFLTIKDKWNGIVDFIDWWNLDNLCDGDYQCEVLQNGKKMPVSTAEAAYLAYAKHLIANRDKDAIKIFIPKMKELSEAHPEMQYPNYYIGKMLLASGTNDNEAVTALLPFVRKKQTEFWAWQLLAEAFENDDDKRMACLLRAVHCHTQEQFLVNLYMILAKAFLQLKYYADARFYLDKYLKVKNDTQTNVSYDANIMVGSQWYKNADGQKISYQLDYQSITNEILFSDIPETNAFVSFVNKEKKMATIIYGRRKSGFFKYDRMIKNLNNGDTIKIRIEEKSDNGFLKLMSARITEEQISTDFFKVVEGKISSNKLETAFFLNDGSDFYYIPSKLLETNQLTLNDSIKANVLYSFDKKRDQWSWVCVT
ncbi:MAG: hypothetical protein J6V74_04950, partial [Bacteroidales bacterium]|nr:hypothetical protein [Bacteroidales bacterium]